MNTIKLVCLISLFAFACSQDSFYDQPPPTDWGLTPSLNDDTLNTVNSRLHHVDSSPIDIVWCRFQNDVIFVLTETNNLYRSMGQEFNDHISTENLQQLSNQQLDGSQPQPQIGLVSSIIVNRADDSVLLFRGTEGVDWITEDCGRTIRAIDLGRQVEEFKFHPTRRDWLLASVWTRCEDKRCEKYKELFISKDLGSTWESLQMKYVSQFEWGVTDDYFIDFPYERIIVMYDPEGRGNQRTEGLSESLEIVYSDDFFKTSRSIVKGGNKLVLNHFFMVAMQVVDEDRQEVRLLVGDPKEKNYTLTPIKLPVKSLKANSYTIPYIFENTTFVQTTHDGKNSRYGDIYVSGPTGVRYTLALNANVRNPDGQSDFWNVKGFDIIYLSNIYDLEALKRLKVSENDSAFQNYKMTRISFNKGSHWHPLTPPNKDSDGEKIICSIDEGCSLHLHGPFYSSEKALGIIISTGNVGSYLSNNPDEINTYLSRDTGLTWFEIAKGPHIYEANFQVSILVMTPTYKATTEVIYSWNQGLTWDVLKISDIPIEVSKIIAEPVSHIIRGEKFLVYGRTKDTARKGAVIALDFTPLQQRRCEYPQLLDLPESDYENWTPSGKFSPNCLMGIKFDITRRKREAECFNEERYEYGSRSRSCNCTEENWECEFGFTRIKGTGPCLPIDPKMSNQIYMPSECAYNDYYHTTQGYRKIAGDTCVGGVDHELIKLPCPEISEETSNLVAFLSIVLIILGLVGLVWLSNKRNLLKLKESLDNLYKKCTACLQRDKNDGIEFRTLGEISDTMRNDDEDKLRI